MTPYGAGSQLKDFLTAQGQISVPVAVRKKLGAGPGSALQWVEAGDRIEIRRSDKNTFEDIRKAIWGDKPLSRKTDEEIEEGLKTYFRRRYARP